MRIPVLGDHENVLHLIGRLLREVWFALSPWRDAAYRRDAMRLLLVGLRGAVGLRLGVAFLLLAATGAYVTITSIDSASSGYDLLALLFGIATILAAAPIYASEQRQGTFELLWLATGSQWAMLRYKVLVLMIALGLLMLPSVLVVSWFFHGTLPVGRSLVFLLTNTLLIISLMAVAGTYLPQPWAGGIVGTIIVVALYVAMRDQVSTFNLFLNPVPSGQVVTAGGGQWARRVTVDQFLVPNRLVVLFFSGFLLSTAARRLRKAFV
jgi:hypothetical protein